MEKILLEIRKKSNKVNSLARKIEECNRLCLENRVIGYFAEMQKTITELEELRAKLKEKI